jgi:hypothetical protein
MSRPEFNHEEPKEREPKDLLSLRSDVDHSITGVYSSKQLEAMKAVAPEFGVGVSIARQPGEEYETKSGVMVILREDKFFVYLYPQPNQDLTEFHKAVAKFQSEQDTQS